MKWMKREVRNERCVLDGEAEELMVEALRTLHNESSKHAEMRKASVKRPVQNWRSDCVQAPLTSRAMNLADRIIWLLAKVELGGKF